MSRTLGCLFLLSVCVDKVQHFGQLKFSSFPSALFLNKQLIVEYSKDLPGFAIEKLSLSCLKY